MINNFSGKSNFSVQKCMYLFVVVARV